MKQQKTLEELKVRNGAARALCSIAGIKYSIDSAETLAEIVLEERWHDLQPTIRRRILAKYEAAQVLLQYF